MNWHHGLSEINYKYLRNMCANIPVLPWVLDPNPVL